MTTAPAPHYGGFSDSCRLFLLDGTLIDVAQLKPGHLLMSAEGDAAEVLKVDQYTGNLTRLEQGYKHSNERYGPENLPLGVTSCYVSDTQRFFFRTGQRVKMTRNTRKGRVVEITQLKSFHLEGFGRLVMPFTGSRTFPSSSTAMEVKNYIYEQTVTSDDGFLVWSGSKKSLFQLNKEIRIATNLLESPINVEIPVLKPWMDKLFAEDVSEEKLYSMAWLLGFWIGDGHRRGALFALHAGDKDVNGYLSLCGERLGTKLDIRRRGDTFKADGALMMPDGSRDKNNPFTNALKELGFYKYGRKGDPKKVPEFLRSETRPVREHFMAGIIDSDGYTVKDEGVYKVAIKTVYEPIRDGILFVARSLGLNITVSFEPAKVGKDFNRSDTWCFHLFRGTNSSAFWSILSKCSCERKRNPVGKGYNRQILALDDVHGQKGDGILNLKPIPFAFSECETGRVYAVHLKGPIGTFLTGEQLLCIGAVQQETSTGQRMGESDGLEPQDKIEAKCTTNSCFFCGRAKNSSFEKMPWDQLNIWCETCRRRCDKSHGICGNKACQWIASEHEVKKENPKCTLCGSAVKIDSSKGNEPRPKPNGECTNCGPNISCRWMRLPWNKSSPLRICRTCYNKYKKTGKYCYHCSKIFNNLEIRLLHGSFSSAGNSETRFLPCNNCGNPTNVSVDEDIV